MIPLLYLRTTGHFASVERIRSSVMEGLHDSFGLRADPARVSVDGGPPALSLIRFDATSGNVDPQRLPPRKKDVTRIDPVLSAQRLEAFGRPVFWSREAEIEWEIAASDAQLGVVHDSRRHAWLAILGLSEGRILLRLREGQMEKILLSGAREAAAGYGVTVESGRLKTHPMHGNSVRVEVDVQAKKSLFRGGLSVSGEVSIDPNLDLRFRNVRCDTHGVIAKMAKPFIDSIISQWEHKPIRLLSEIFGEVQAREMDVKFGREGALDVRAVLGRLEAGGGQ